MTLAASFLFMFLLAACAPQPATAPTIAPPTVRATRIAPTPSLQLSAPPSSQPTQSVNRSTPELDDAHIHYDQNSWAEYSVTAILSVLNRQGIHLALVSSTPNEGTLKLYAAGSSRIVPEFRPYRTDGDASRWFANAETVMFVEEGLKNAAYRGFGEFHLYGDQAKTPVVKRVVDLAVEHNLVLHAHSDDAAIENLFSLNPRAKIIWAHTGMTTPTATVAKMLGRHPNLWADLSYRYDVSSNGKLDPAWRELFLKFPDRFMYGTDTWVESRWGELPGLVLTAHGWLAELPSDVAERIAHQNFDTLFGR